MIPVRPQRIPLHPEPHPRRLLQRPPVRYSTPGMPVIVFRVATRKQQQGGLCRFSLVLMTWTSTSACRYVALTITLVLNTGLCPVCYTEAKDNNDFKRRSLLTYICCSQEGVLVWKYTRNRIGPYRFNAVQNAVWWEPLRVLWSWFETDTIQENTGGYPLPLTKHYHSVIYCARVTRRGIVVLPGTYH